MEESQFIDVVNSHMNLIYKICMTYCKDPEDQRDLQQEILIQMWNSFKRFDGRVKISTWIYRVALNTAISFYRKENKHPIKTRLSSEAAIYLIDNEIEEDIKEKINLLYSFIGALNEMEKALMLLYLDENSYKEISEILGISETNVATKISRIKRGLKDKFNNY